MNRIRLLQVVPTLQCGGAERMVVNLMTHLDRQRVEAGAIVLGPADGGTLERSLQEGGFRVWFLGKGGAFDPQVPFRIRRIVREFQPDIVHSHLCLHYVFPALAGSQAVRHISTVHLPGDLRYARFMLALTRLAFRRGAIPVAVSAEVAAWVRGQCRAHDCVVIPNGIPISHYQRLSASRSAQRTEHGLNDEDVAFVCVARLEKQKNHAMLLEAFARRFAAEPRAHLLVVGDGACRPSLELRAGELGIESKVRFLGQRADVPQVLSAADVFVLASQNEGNPLALMEAMAAGLPVVATAVGGVPELIADRKSGLLVMPGDSDGFGLAMIRLFRDLETRRTMAACAAAHAFQAFSASRMARVYLELYERTLDRSAAASALSGPTVQMASHYSS